MNQKYKWEIKLDNIKIQWGDDVIFNDFNMQLTLENEKFIPLCGRTGCGKTTIMHVMSSLKTPKEGIITWSFPDGESFEWSDKNPLKPAQKTLLRSKYFGIAFQSSIMLDHLTIAENLIARLRIRLGYQTDEYDKIVTALKSVLTQEEEESKDIRHWLNKYPQELSGGQLHRFSLAQVIVKNPYVLFADEPTSSLDSTTRKEVMQVLWKWVNEGKGERVLIWITHNLDQPNEFDLQRVKKRYYLVKNEQYKVQLYRKEIEEWVDK